MVKEQRKADAGVTPVPPKMCEEERAACLGCLDTDSKFADCSAAVEAYSKCIASQK